MNYDKLSSLKFWELVDNEITRERFQGNRRVSLYPSEASVVCTDPDSGKKYLEGGCHRKSMYRILGYKETNPPGAKGMYTFEFGIYLERMITDLVKRGYIYETNSVKFFNKKLMVSGEIDIVLRHPEGGRIFVEAKSSYGDWKERELFGHYEGRGENKTWKPGSPSTQNVLQLVTYLWEYKDDPELLGGKLIYILRDNMSRIEFNIHIKQEESTGKHRVMINNKPEMRYYVEDLIERYQELLAHVNKAGQDVRNGIALADVEMPPRDYSLVYTPEEATEKYGLGIIFKTKYEKFMANPQENPLGDFQCGYCSFKDLCWKKQDIAAHTEGAQTAAPKPKRRTKNSNKTTLVES